jgi:hypothetical protein
VPGVQDASVKDIQGVQMVLRTQAWTGYPRGLEDLLLPLRVGIVNNSPHRLRLNYDAFTLRSSEGISYASLSPYEIQSPYRRFVAPLGTPLTPFYYPPVDRWNRFDFEPYYDMYYGYPGPFPSGDMLDRAIPEGILEPNGSIRGFLYFPRISKDGYPLRFRALLIDADTGRTFGEIEIPLVAR